jgi:hypothetical protein
MRWYIILKGFFIGVLAGIIGDAYTQEKDSYFFSSWDNFFLFCFISVVISVITFRPGD